MMHITQRASNGAEPVDWIELPFELRQRSRIKTKLVQSGRDAAIVLPRGTVLRGGELLISDHGEVVRVQAAPEAVSTVTTTDAFRLAKACYHLGNRHVPLQITPQRVRYLVDHVLDDMVIQMGLTVVHETAPFEPEAGAYEHHGKHQLFSFHV